MKKIKNQILGVIAFFLLIAGLTNAAAQIDPINNQVVSKQEIKEFTSFCATIDPR
jgi:hypothetical protein